MPSTEQVKIAWLQGCAVVPVGGREGRTRGDEVESQPVGWMLAGPRMPGACWGCAGQGWTSGGALQDGQGRVGRAWHVVTASRMNRPTTGVELSVRHGPFPLCIPRHHHLPAAQPNNCPVVPTPWIVCRFRIPPPHLPGPQDSPDLSSVTAPLASAGARPCSNWPGLQTPEFSQTTTMRYRPVLDDTLQAPGAYSPRKVLGTIPAPHAAVGHQVPVTLLL